MNDEDRLAVPGHEESIVSDYIRNRVEPPADMVSGRDIFKVETVKQPEGDYEKDFKKLQSLTQDQIHQLLTEVEIKSRENRGLFSEGNLLNGYAIDPETLKSLQSINHSQIDSDLATEILQNSENNYDLNALKILTRRIIIGFVYLEIPSFKTPIVKLLLGSEEMGDKVPEEDVQKIADYLKRERKLLPISSDFRVL